MPSVFAFVIPTCCGSCCWNCPGHWDRMHEWSLLTSCEQAVVQTQLNACCPRVFMFPPLKPLKWDDIRWLSGKPAFPFDIGSDKRVGELNALSVARDCLHWNTDGSGIAMFYAFKVNLFGSLHLKVRGRGTASLLSVSFVHFGHRDTSLICWLGLVSLMCYLFIMEGTKKCSGLSKQRPSHWVVDTFTQEYRLRGLQVPAVKCHATISVPTSWAALRGVPLRDINVAAMWASSCTFGSMNSGWLPEFIASLSLVEKILWATSSTDRDTGMYYQKTGEALL